MTATGFNATVSSLHKCDVLWKTICDINCEMAGRLWNGS